VGDAAGGAEVREAGQVVASREYIYESEAPL
jgi:hypothetical protein